MSLLASLVRPTFARLFRSHRGRLAHKWPHYFPLYDRHFARFRGKPCTFVEIGCGEGGSLQLWKRFLGRRAKIVGLDIRPECREFAEEQIHIEIGDQSDTAFLDEVLNRHGVPDVILDDGSHLMKDQKASFLHLYPQMHPEGVYFVEDLHTSYWEEFGGGLQNPETFIELAKEFLDHLNARHTRGALEPTNFSAQTHSLHSYDSVCVFERKPAEETASCFAGGTGEEQPRF